MTQQAPSFLSEPQVVDIGRLIEDVRQGDIQVPRFQRPFIWEDQRRIELLRSIRSGIPIGSLLVWRTATKRLRCFERIAGVTIPRPHEGRTISFLLDGHQRVTSIFGAFTKDAVENLEERQRGDAPTPIVYNVEKDDFEIEIDTPAGKKAELRVPLYLFLDAVSLRRMFRDLERSKTWQLEALDALQSRAEEVLNCFERCRIPIIPLTTEDVGLATRTFHRVNSQGIHMSEIHMVAALSWKEDFDLREEIEKAWSTQALPYTWKPTDEQQVLNVIKGALDLEVAKSSEEKLIKGLGADPRLVGQAVAAVAKAIWFASDYLKLSGPGTIPYEMQLTLLAASLVAKEALAEIQDPEQVRRWWGLTTVWGTFGGGASHRVQAAFRHLKAGVGGDRQPWPEVLFRSIEPIPLPALDFRNARAKYFIDGYANNSGQLELLRARGTRSLLSLYKQHSTTPGNRFLWPSEKIHELRSLLSNGALDTLTTHFVDNECIALYNAGKAEEFVKYRAGLMNAQERAWFKGLCAQDFINPADINPADIKPADINPADIKPAGTENDSGLEW